MSIFSYGCLGEAWAPPYYKGSLGMITDDMIAVKDKENKLDFKIPAGWLSVPEDEALPENLELPREHRSAYGDNKQRFYRKGDKGSMTVFCRIMGVTNYLVEQSMYELAPSMVSQHGGLQISSKGWDPVMYEYEASSVEEGEKKGFAFMFAEKMQGTFSLYNCDYYVIARSADLESAEEIKSDFIAVVRTLKN
jgi:hypothetical protein